MALFRKLFGRGEPAPPLPIRPEDQDLVSDADTAWWNTMTLKELAKIEERPDARMAMIGHSILEGLKFVVRDDYRENDLGGKAVKE